MERDIYVDGERERERERENTFNCVQCRMCRKGVSLQTLILFTQFSSDTYHFSPCLSRHATLFSFFSLSWSLKTRNTFLKEKSVACLERTVFSVVSVVSVLRELF